MRSSLLRTLLASLPIVCGCHARQSASDGEAAREAPEVPGDLACAIKGCDSTSPPAARDWLYIDSLPPLPGAEQDLGSTYIDSVFRTLVGRPPSMGWFVGQQLLAGERHPRVFVYSADSAVLEGRFARLVPQAEHDSISHANAMACEFRGPLAAYDLGAAPRRSQERAFFLPRPLPGPTSVGLRLRPLRPVERGAARAIMPLGGRPALYLDTAIEISGGSAPYSLTAAYNPSDRALFLSVIALHDSTGRVIASHFHEPEEFECDGCAPPEPSDGLFRLYPLLGGFASAGFAYPLLLLDTSTLESRGISLVTFGPHGDYSEHNVSEYVVTCIVGEGR